jgi:methylglutaconyl-CoA hydratase
LIDYRVVDSIARITLNRPEKRNAIDNRIITEMSDALQLAHLNEAVRALVIAGAGKDFCAGLDIAMLRETSEAGILKQMEAARSLADVFVALRSHPRPTVAVVHGRAFGGGCGLATACDVVLASESAQFGYPEVNIGFVPAIVMSLLRPSVGEKAAFELLTSGDPIGAREAHRIGMITHVYSADELEAKAEEYASRLAKKSPSAIALTKRLLHQIDGMPLDAAIEAGVEVNAIARLTEDARRGFEQFTKKK